MSQQLIEYSTRHPIRVADGTVLLQGIVGSTAYGLAGPNSDVDRLGIYAADTLTWLGLNPPPDKRQTRTRHDPDVTMHEALKFARLGLEANPTTTELMWLPDEYVEQRHPLGDALRDIRRSFLSSHAVRKVYLGYCDQQFQRLVNKGRYPNVPVDRIAKHSRHLYRLVEQGTALWVTGELPIRVQSPERIRGFAERVAAGHTDLAASVMARAEATFTHTPTVLPEEPDRAPVEAWIRDVRRTFWTET